MMFSSMLEPLRATLVVSAIELGSVWMLGWLAAAAIPLALHLLHRRRQQEVVWAAVELLMQAIRQNSRTIRIEQWLLLALRTLALLLFAFALARPLMLATSSANTAPTVPPKLWIIVLDASYSMGYKADRLSLWEQAQQRAIDFVKAAGQEDAFTLIQLAEPSMAVIGQPVFDSSRVIAEIQRMQCSDEGGDLASCLELVRQTIDEVGQDAGFQQNMQVVFISDMGRDTWQPATVSSPTREMLEGIAARYEVQIETVRAESIANVAVTAFEADSPLVLEGKSLRCTATIENFGSANLARLPVQFQSGGSTLRTEFVDCPAGQSRSVSTELPAPPARDWNVTARLPDDNLLIDNRRDLVISVRPQLRVMTIESTSGSTRWINLSLAPHALDRSDPAAPIVVETSNVIELSTRSLANVDAVVLVDVEELTSSQTNVLRDYVNNGGALLALVGPRTSSAAWNQTSDSLAQLFGFRLIEPSALGDWRIDPLGYSSPLPNPLPASSMPVC